MVARTARLPGFRFEVQPPPLAETLPRMDVAVFVGFAASGPLRRPVVVEDAAQFANIFGDDLPLAWDAERGEQVYAYLAPAVQAFFRNGGRRCWVVRVARTADAGADQRVGCAPAVANRFALAGLVRVSETGAPVQAHAVARSEGSWSDGLRVGTALQSQPAHVAGMWVEDGALQLALSAPGNLAPGDLLRVTFPNQGYVLMLAVQLVKPIPAGALSPFADGPLWEVSGLALWFRSAAPLSPPAGPIPARLLTQDAREVDVLALAQTAEDGPIDVELGLALEDAPAPGSFARLDFGGEQLWLTIEAVTGMAGGSSPLGDTVRISGRGLWRLHDPPAPLPIVDTDTYGERLTFELWVGPGDYPIRLSDLGFMPQHPRFWGGLPSDDQLFAPADKTALAVAPELSGLWREVAQPRFPLCGAAPAVYLPIGMPDIADVDQFLGAQLGAATALERDGLACFSAGLFLDTALKDVGTTALLEQADFVRYQQPAPRALAGIYAALEIDEATLIAVPDAVHRGWDRADDAELPAPQPEAPSAPPEDCTPPRAPAGEQGQFGDCAAIGAPQLFAIAPPSGLAAYTIRWSPLAAPLAGYVLEEATRADFGDAQAVYAGAANRATLDSRGEGVYFYRVRAEVTGQSGIERGSWSNGVGVRIGAQRPWRLAPIAAFEPAQAPALAVDRALLRMCAAKGDLFAVLALPAHYREDEALAHVAGLGAQLTDDRDRTLSFGAIYHPWLIGRREDAAGELRATPPDGAACGTIARRALERGAWIAPANEVLRNVVALTPPLAADRRLDLQEGSINTIRQEPRGFLALSANTLSTDLDVRPINVRRLLSLLRRLAQRLGATYVFEPNDAAFRRRVQRGFEALLDDMFVRGAFVGATADSAYRVDTGPTINTAQSVDAGRLIVELRVAPARPLTFLTIRLVQTGDRAFLIVER